MVSLPIRPDKNMRAFTMPVRFTAEASGIGLSGASEAATCTWSEASSASWNVSGNAPISGSGRLTINGSGSDIGLTLSGNSSFTGAIVINRDSPLGRIEHRIGSRGGSMASLHRPANQSRRCRGMAIVQALACRSLGAPRHAGVATPDGEALPSLTAPPRASRWSWTT